MNRTVFRLPNQTNEIEMTLGDILVRTDLDQNSITVGFKHWFEWHIDTKQVEVGRGLIHFVQPDNTIVGIRIDHGSTGHEKSHEEDYRADRMCPVRLPMTCPGVGSRPSPG